LDTTTALLFGKSVYSLRASIDQEAENRIFAESFNIAQEGLAKRFRIAPFHFLYNPSSFKAACKNAHRYVEQYIETRNLQATKTNLQDETSSFIDQIATESESVGELRDQILNILLAGRDTTACCLSWTLYVLFTPSLRRLLTVSDTLGVFLSVTLLQWTDFAGKYVR
jgi:cytochrome P450